MGEAMSKRQSSRTLLFKQADIVRTSLLLSLGFSPLACDGTSVTSGNNGGGGSTQTTAGTRDPGTAGARPTSGAGGQSGGENGAGASGYSGGGGDADLCPNPVLDAVTGLVSCSNGLVHRPEAQTCMGEVAGAAGAGGEDSSATAGSAATAGSGGATTVGSFCQKNDDCTAVPRGFCDRGVNGAGMPVCHSGCASDSDCIGGAFCMCSGGNPGRCTSGACAVDADCGDNSLCALTVGPCGNAAFHCTTAQDECLTDEDCGGTRARCIYEGGHRACSSAVCGRPFLVADAPRMAAVEGRADWLDLTLSADASALTPLERAQLAAHWARLGQLEHASIAAFARFNLQLLSLGAPSHLVEACNRALADETAHARSCFALATSYGGTAVGPARLDVEHCFEEAGLVEIARLVLREGCLGETVASLEALAAAELASAPTVKEALEGIARDELRHAELAFQFLRWALSLSSAEVRHELAADAAQQLADFEIEAQNGERTLTDDRLAAHGLLGDEALRAIHLAAVRNVSRPLLAALFGTEAFTVP